MEIRVDGQSVRFTTQSPTHDKDMFDLGAMAHHIKSESEYDVGKFQHLTIAIDDLVKFIIEHGSSANDMPPLQQTD